MDKTLLLRASVQGQNALLTLNGMVLGKLQNGRELVLPIHEYVQSGENRIQVILLPGGSMRGASLNPDHALLTQNCTTTVWVEPWA